MWREIKVLLVDDDAQRRHDLKVILDFLGEEVIVAGTDQWLKDAEAKIEDSTEISAVILGDSHGKPLESVIESLLDWDKAVSYTHLTLPTIYSV